MPSSKEYLDFILDQLSDLDNISYRAMQGFRIINSVKKTVAHTV